MSLEDGANFMSALAEGAIAAHEMFKALRDAGFEEQQALYLVGQMLRGASSE